MRTASQLKQDGGQGRSGRCYLCGCEHGGRYDFIGAEGLTGVDEGSEDLSTFFAFRCCAI